MAWSLLLVMKASMTLVMVVRSSSVIGPAFPGQLEISVSGGRVRV